MEHNKSSREYSVETVEKARKKAISLRKKAKYEQGEEKGDLLMRIGELYEAEVFHPSKASRFYEKARRVYEDVLDDGGDIDSDYMPAGRNNSYKKKLMVKIKNAHDSAKRTGSDRESLSGLERSAAFVVVSIVLVVIGFLLMNPSITGGVIGSVSSKLPSFFGSLFIFVGLIFVSAYVAKKNLKK